MPYTVPYLSAAQANVPWAIPGANPQVSSGRHLLRLPSNVTIPRLSSRASPGHWEPPSIGLLLNSLHERGPVPSSRVNTLGSTIKASSRSPAPSPAGREIWRGVPVNPGQDQSRPQPRIAARSPLAFSRKCYSRFMLAASITVFSLLLVQAGSPPQSPDTAGQPSASGTQTASAPQHKKPRTARYFATIIQSGSTNSRPYKVFIHSDGSATVQLEGSPSALHPQAAPPREQHVAAGTIDAKTLRQLLEQVADVSQIPIGSCMKSVSFGTRTQISYAGKMSGDLQCIKAGTSSDADSAKLQASQALGKLVQGTLSNLKVNASRLAREP